MPWYLRYGNKDSMTLNNISSTHVDTMETQVCPATLPSAGTTKMKSKGEGIQYATSSKENCDAGLKFSVGSEESQTCASPLRINALLINHFI